MDTSPIELTYLEGTVSSVLFRNEENGYTVLRISAGEDTEITVVGFMPGIAPGEGLAVHGCWEQHSMYGRQLKVEIMERKLPIGEEAVFRYLASGVIKGIGAITARRLVDAFGADTLTVIEENPEQLTEVHGITRKRALAIGEALRLQLSMRRLLDFLSAHDLPLQAAIPLYRRLGEDALIAIRNNPYLLTDETIGAAFQTSDKLAISLGFEEDNPLRLEAGLLFELTHNLDNGHVFLPRDKLLAATAQLLQVKNDALLDALDALAEQGRIVRSEIAGEDACYLPRLYDCECYVARTLKRMADAELHPSLAIDKLLDRIQMEQGISYAPLQKEAVYTAAHRQVMLLTGGPGTGKTTSLRGILGLFTQLGLNTVLTAPTGRAAKRLSETCGGVDASTIHRLLETRYDPSKGSLAFSRNEGSPLTADAVIVDEASMVDIPLMCALLSAMRSDCRLVLVGDPNQLPSVGPGNLLSDLIRSAQIPSLCLTEIFRQAAVSSIVRNAHAVNEGKAPELVNSANGDFFFLRRIDPSSALNTIVDLCSNRLPENLGISPDQIQVLSPTRRGITGTLSLNRALQQALNPPQPEKAERIFGSQCFRIGDRVMQVKNNYDLLWQDDSGKEFGMGIFNGDIGRINSIDVKSSLMTVDFDGRLAEYTPDLLNQLEPAYAITVHKAQGSEYRAVVLCAVDAASMLLTRGVLYTAITRAKELLILVGDET
ncbi:MAG: RecD-like helicase YrrC, partial [Evtepia sp.]|nr:RecD-like helicase YrrC [Evtepia sp.]